MCMAAIPVMAKNKQLVVLHTNDTHSCVMPMNLTSLIQRWQTGRILAPCGHDQGGEKAEP